MDTGTDIVSPLVDLGTTDLGTILTQDSSALAQAVRRLLAHQHGQDDEDGPDIAGFNNFV